MILGISSLTMGAEGCLGDDVLDSKGGEKEGWPENKISICEKFQPFKICFYSDLKQKLDL